MTILNQIQDIAKQSWEELQASLTPAEREQLADRDYDLESHTDEIRLLYEVEKERIAEFERNLGRTLVVSKQVFA